MMREYNPTDLIVKAAKFSQKTKESMEVWLVWPQGGGGNDIPLTRQGEGRMSNIITHPVLWQHLHGVQCIQGIFCLTDNIFLAHRKAWSNERLSLSTWFC